MLNAYFRRHVSARGALFAATLGLLAAGADVTRAVEAYDLVSKNTAAFIRVTDGAAMAEKFRQTGLGRMLADPQMRPFVEAVYGSALEATDFLNRRLGTSLTELLEYLRAEVSAGVIVEYSGDRVFFFTLETRDRQSQIEDLLDQVCEQLSVARADIAREEVDGRRWTSIQFRDNPLVLTYAFHGGRLLVASEKGTLQQMIDAGDGKDVGVTLRQLGRFVSVRDASLRYDGTDPDLLLYVDPLLVARSFLQGNPAGVLALTMLPFTGLDGIEAIGGGSTLLDGEFEGVMRAHVILKRPRQGLVKAVAFEELDPQPEPWVPSKVLAYTTGRVNFSKVYDSVCATLDQIPGWTPGDAHRAVQGRFQQIDIDFRREVLACVEGRLSHVVIHMPPYRLDSQGQVFGFLLKDPTIAETLVEKIAGLGGDRVVTKSVQGTRVYAFQIPVPEEAQQPAGIKPPEPAFCVAGDYLFFTDRAPSLEFVLAARNNPSLGLADDLEFKLVRSTLLRLVRDKKVIGISFARPEEGIRYWFELAQAEQSRQLLQAGAEQNPFFRGVNDALTAHPLPPFEMVQKYFAPEGTVYYEDETGLHMLDVTLLREGP